MIRDPGEAGMMNGYMMLEGTNGSVPGLFIADLLLARSR